MARIELCDEPEVTRLVHGFYARVRQDATLGPFFDAHVADWDHHLAKMVDFWSSTLRGTARYRGTPMPKHAALPGLDAGMFEHWLRLFRETTLTLDNPGLRERADDLAARIAQSLWYGYQITRAPDRIPEELGERAALGVSDAH
ncbi:MAG: group III truncated hemoglobin [Pseudomonadota bacterium]